MLVMLKRISVFTAILVLNLFLFNPFAENHAIGKSMDLSSSDIKKVEDSIDQAIEGNEQYEFVDEVKDEDGSILLTTTTLIDRKINKDEKNGIITVTLVTNSTIEYADGTIKKEKDIDEISFSKDGDFYINGEEIAVDELMQEFSAEENVKLQSSGGYNWLTYYERQSNTYYYKAHKEPSNNFLDPPGTDVYWHGYSYNMNSEFNSLARTVESHRDNIVQSTFKLMAMMGVTMLTWFNVVTLIAQAGPAAVEALSLFNNSSKGKRYMRQAYDIQMQ